MNDKDFDDLFRQASEQYPLRTDSADWDRVAAALNEEDDPSAAMIPVYFSDRIARRKRFLWLLVLIPFAGLGYYLMNDQKSVNPYPVVSETPAVVNKLNTPVTTAPDVNGHIVNAKMSSASVPGISLPAGTNRHPSAASAKGSANEAAITAAMEKKPLPELVSSWEDIQIGDIGPITPGTKKDIVKTSFKAVDAASGQQAKASVVKIKQKSRSYFYAGLIVAPDISTIKFQKIDGLGYTAGALIGYAISPKIAIESGAYYDRKKYYSNGEYFSKGKVPYLNNVNILSVDGACNMIEVPLNLRYNFSSGKRNKWFATTGLSTYFMFKDAYDYELNRGSRTWSSYHNYKKSSQNWFSVVNISAGYEYRLGAVGNLRLEPYLRIPLTGMGTGSLHIMSAGLNIGITRRIK